MKQILLLVFATVCACPQDAARPTAIPKNGFVPKGGFVSGADVAVAIAEAVLTPVYGKETVTSERPFKATLNRGIWLVRGKVPCEGSPDAVCPGGAGEVWIAKRSGQILYMNHDQ